MNILDLKKINIIVLSLLLFLSMQIPVFASENAAEVKIPVVQVVENEAKEQAEEFSYVLTTNQSEAPMPKGSKENQYCWSMKKKETVEISIPVTTRGIYHYQIYQTTEPKEAYAYQHNEVFRISEENYEFAANRDLPVSIWNNEMGYQIVAQWKKADTKTVSVEHYLKQPDGKEYLAKTTVGSILFSEEQDTFTIFGNPEPDGTFPGYVFDKEDSQNQTKVIIKKDEISDNYVLKVYYKPTVLTVSKTVKGYTLDEDKAFTFTIQARAPSGTDASASIIQDGQIYIRKEGKIEKLTFTNNKATFTLKDKESVDISCLPMEWTYTIEENPGSNYETTCQKTGGSVVDGRMLSFQMEQESESVSFVNASKVAPPVTGKTVQNNSFILLLVLVFGVGIVSFGFFERIKRKHR